MASKLLEFHRIFFSKWFKRISFWWWIWQCSSILKKIFETGGLTEKLEMFERRTAKSKRIKILFFFFCYTAILRCISSSYILRTYSSVYLKQLPLNAKCCFCSKPSTALSVFTVHIFCAELLSFSDSPWGMFGQRLPCAQSLCKFRP